MSDGRLHAGDDGIVRCWWCGNDDLYQRYHDTEWGRTLHGERNVFEKITLEGMQAGLSWITILRKRETFREAFANFEIDKVARFTPAKIEKLMQNPGVIRNRAKIQSAVSNAQIADTMLQSGQSLDEFVWSFAPKKRRGPLPLDGAIEPATDESRAMSKALLKKGFRFVGPTTMYAFMQSSGMVNDHMVGCHVAKACK
jgi:DNA-3-methyladenine glycosylase I